MSASAGASRPSLFGYADGSFQQQQSHSQPGLQSAHTPQAHPPTFPQQPAQPQPQMYGHAGFPPQQNPTSPLSLGTFPGIPTKTIGKIQRGEYIDFNKLYSAILFGDTTKAGFALHLDDQSDGMSSGVSLVPRRLKRRRPRSGTMLSGLELGISSWSSSCIFGLIWCPS